MRTPGCACHDLAGVNPTLCELHAQVFRDRVAQMTEFKTVWNQALDDVQDKLHIRESSDNPMTRWILGNLNQLRKR